MAANSVRPPTSVGMGRIVYWLGRRDVAATTQVQLLVRSLMALSVRRLWKYPAPRCSTVGRPRPPRWPARQEYSDEGNQRPFSAQVTIQTVPIATSRPKRGPLARRAAHKGAHANPRWQIGRGRSLATSAPREAAWPHPMTALQYCPRRSSPRRGIGHRRQCQQASTLASICLARARVSRAGART